MRLFVYDMLETVNVIYYVHVCEQARWARTAGNSAIENLCIIIIIITEAKNQLHSNTTQTCYRPVVKSTRPESVMQIPKVSHLKWTSQHWCHFQNNVLYVVLYWDPYYRLAKHLFKAYFRQNPVLFYYFLMSGCRKQNNNSNNNKK